MPVTILGQRDSLPRSPPTLVQIKRAWSDDWLSVPAMQFISARVAAGSAGIDEAVVSYRYGQVKQPWESAVAAVSAWPSAAGWWLRVLLAGDQGLLPIFCGRISGESRLVMGAESTPSGMQELVCYGALQMLEKISISTSWWKDPDTGDPIELGWLPAINQRDGRGIMRGNRSDIKKGEPASYVYDVDDTDRSDTPLWTHRQYLDYVLARYIEYDDGPTWTLGGELDALENLTESIDLGDSITAADLLRALIPPRLGLDFVVRPTDEGFEIGLFSLTAHECSFGGTTFPRNPHRVEVRAGEAVENIRTTIVASADYLYSTVRVLGRRIVVCFSLHGQKVLLFSPFGAAQLTPTWPDALETDYCQPPAFDPAHPSELDDLREGHEYEPVFGHFAAPTTWDLKQILASAKCSDLGLIEETEADCIRSIRSTLPWLPMIEGYDYSVDPALNCGATDVQGELVRPLCWFWARPWRWEWDATQYVQYEGMGHGRYISAESAGVHVSVPNDEWGVHLKARPNHLLGLSHFNFTQHYTQTPPLFDYEEAVATIAVEGDHRLSLTARLPGAPEGLGTLDIVVDDAHCWVLAPKTAVGVKSDAQSLYLSGDSLRVVRNDVDRLYAAMAGALTRYFRERMRAEIVAKGLWPWNLLLGQILACVQEGGSTHRIESPITSVTYRAGDDQRDGETLIQAGYAG